LFTNLTSLLVAPVQAQVYAVGYRDLAKQCIANNVKHLVILDSVCTVESDTCNSMAMGEDALRDLYAKAPEGLTYTIVRSGQLYNGESRGPEQIEVNQGGDKSGVISRQVCAAAADDDTITTTSGCSEQSFHARVHLSLFSPIVVFGYSMWCRERERGSVCVFVHMCVCKRCT